MLAAAKQTGTLRDSARHGDAPRPLLACSCRVEERSEFIALVALSFTSHVQIIHVPTGCRPGATCSESRLRQRVLAASATIGNLAMGYQTKQFILTVFLCRHIHPERAVNNWYRSVGICHAHTVSARSRGWYHALPSASLVAQRDRCRFSQPHAESVDTVLIWRLPRPDRSPDI